MNVIIPYGNMDYFMRGRVEAFSMPVGYRGKVMAEHTNSMQVSVLSGI